MSETATPNPPIAPAGRDAWRRVAPVATSSITMGVLLAWASWPITAAQLVPQFGLDPSWQASLAMAAHRHLHFGTEVVWTYGPLGFLTTRQLYFPLQAFAALWFHFGLATATFAVLVAALRRHTSLPVAVVVAYAAGFPMAAIWGGEEVLLPLALVIAVRVLSRPSESTRLLPWLTLGALTAFMALEKLGLAGGIGAVTVIALGCSASRGRLRNIGVTAASFSVGFPVGWFGTGNRVGNLAAYARSAREAAVGYPAMALDPVAGYHRFVIVAGLVAIAVIAMAATYARRLRYPPVETDREPGLPGDGERVAFPAAAGMVGATALVLWLLFKEGFVRQIQHQVVFFAAIPLIIAAFVLGPAPTPRDEERTRPATRSGVRLVVALLVASLIAFASFGPVPATFADPITSARGFLGTLRGIALASRRHDVVNAARAAQQSYYAIPPAMLARIGSSTVDVDPVEQSVAWAYPTLHWKPLPTLQSYFAYTGALDRLNVDAIDSRHAPQFILRQRPWTIDGRRADFDAPATRIAIECNYRPVAATSRWQLLEHTDGRCGTPRELGRVHVRFGESVTVPGAAADEMVVARIDLHLPWWWRLADTLYKPPMITMRVDDAAVASRFLAGTASQPHLMAPARTTDFRPPFRAFPIHTFELGVAGTSSAGYSATITFSAIPMA